MPALPLVVAAARMVGVGSVSIVGGPVRDALLGRASFDIDVVFEGDALAVGRELARAHGGELVVHDRFGTATWRGIDLVTARRESYPRPGQLPVVEPADLSADLARRDATVNAMAWRLWPSPGLVDPHGGLADLRAGRLRVLHPRSFADDPTRMARLLRYGVRLGLRLHGETARLLADGLLGVGRVSGARWMHEWRRLCAERDPAAHLRAWRASGLGSALGIGRAGPDLARLGPEAALMAVLAPSHAPLWGFDGAPRTRLERLVALAGSLPVPAPRLAEALRTWSPALRAAIAVRAPRHAGLVAEACALLASPPLLTGADVVAAGVPPGPGRGALLAEARGAQWRGELTTRAQALAWLRLADPPEPR